MPQDFVDELAAVHAEVTAAIETEHASLGEFIRYEANTRDDSPLAGIVLAAALPASDSAEAQASRIHLAAAMLLLDVALALHKLLLLQQPNTQALDKSLVGGTVLAGDYCFSQAAVAAARTGNPQVVAIFSELLKELSEAHLRHLFEQSGGALDEFPLLFQSGALAGAVLAGMDGAAQQRTADFAASLAHYFAESSQPPALDPLADHQRPRWLALLQSGVGK